MTELERITDPFEIQFPKLGWEFHVDPTAFTVFGIEIQWYGIIITLGLVLAMLYCFPKMKKFGLDSDRVIDVVIGGVIGGILGARIYYVLLRWEEYGGDWKSMLNFRNGGLAIYGGLIGAVAVGLVICKIRKVKVLPMLDIAVIGFLIGQGIGRWGNFVNQEAFGVNTDSLFGMTGGTIQQTIINQTQIGGEMYLNGNETMLWEVPVHPCFLYESVWCLLGVVVLSLMIKRRKFDGQLFLTYLAWYGAERFVVEGLRIDSLMIGNIRASQALSAILAVTAIVLLIVMFAKVKRDPESFVLYCNTEESKALLAEAEAKKSDTVSKQEEKSEEYKNTIIEEEDETAESAEEETAEADETDKKAETAEVKNQEENENGTDN